MTEQQARIEGTFDEVPAEVQKAADIYVESMRDKAHALTTMNEKKAALIETMKEHKVTEVEIDNGEKKILFQTTDTVVVKSVKGDGKDGPRTLEDEVDGEEKET